MNKTILFIILSITAMQVFAEDVNITASAPGVVTLGQQFQVVFSINAKPKSFTAPTFKDFTILAGPYTSSQSSIQVINGEMSQSVEYSYTYVLQANKEGKFTIEEAKATVGGKTYSSNIITIEVVKGSASAPPSSGGQQQQQQNRQESENVEENKEDIFVKILTDKKEAYQGEAITATIKIFSRINISDLQNAKFPSFNGFTKEEIETPQITLQREIINGKVHLTGIIKKYVLIPQHSGEITIDPFELDVIYQQRVNAAPRSIFDDFFGTYRDVKQTVKSEPFKIKIKPLPEPKPAGFTGGVGNFNFSASIDKPKAKQNDGITLKIKISGNGNIKYTDLPKISFPSDFEVYDPKITTDVKASSNGLTGSKIFEYLIIPRHYGNYTIPSFNFTYFDIASKQYKTYKSPEFNLNIEKSNEPSSTPMVSGFSKEDISFFGKDIRYIKTNNIKLYQKNKQYYGAKNFYLAYLISFVLFIAIIIISRKQIKERANIQKVKNKRANRLAIKRLKQAKIAIKENDNQKFYEEISKALWGYIGDKLFIPTADLSKEIAINELIKREVNKQLIDELIDIIDKCEFARYAPSAINVSMTEIYNSAAKVISKLENEMK